VALSGGKTPVALYQKLSQQGLPWEKTHIFLADERFVPWSDSESNFGMIKSNFLDKINIPEANVHPIKIKETYYYSTGYTTFDSIPERRKDNGNIIKPSVNLM